MTISDEVFSDPNIAHVTIEEEMRSSYMDYAMSVIIGRALPDVRDGLKPVHRRILYAMFDEGLLSNRKFSKCAGVVGEVLKKYHPHGDSAVYDALVRMAQPWNLRYPLINGQGNFGSLDGDAAAAYRYTESRMQLLAEYMLADIERETVDFTPNFDESTQEPVVLPSRIPQLLINGAEGIAVGMASKIPPHNLGEIMKAAVKVIENPQISVDELLEVVPGPDFPTAGIIYGSRPIREIYSTGRGLLQLRAKVRVETIRVEKRESEAIIVDEIPYQVNKAKLVERIAELVQEKKIEGISRLRDESDRQGLRIVIELKRDAVSEVVLNQLFKLSPLQRTFGVTMLAIVAGRPQVLSLREMLLHFINHRREVIVRRTKFELRRQRARLHILEGLLIALRHIEEVIMIIRASQSTAEARVQLEERFSLSEIQAQHILDMPLKRLTALEQKSLEDEHRELVTEIEQLQRILNDSSEVDRLVRIELEEVAEKFADPRRTEIVTDTEDIDLEDLIAEEDMVVTISHRGYSKRCSPSLYKTQHRGGKGVMGTKKSDEDEDIISELFVASTHAYLLSFTDTGRLYWLKVYALPEAGRTSRGRALVNMLQLEEGEKVTTVLPVRHFEEDRFVFFATERGVVKRVKLQDLSNVRRGGVRAAELDDGDRLISTRLTTGNQECILTTRNGMSIRFSEDDVRVMGRTARGVRGIMLENGDAVIAMQVVDSFTSIGEDEESSGKYSLLTICERGYGKRTLLSEYRLQSRGGKGTIDIKTTERNGAAVMSLAVTESDEVMLVTTSGKMIRIRAAAISCVGRNTMGVSLISLEADERVVAATRIAESGESESSSGDENGNEDSAAESRVSEGSSSERSSSEEQQSGPNE